MIFFYFQEYRAFVWFENRHAVLILSMGIVHLVSLLNKNCYDLRIQVGVKWSYPLQCFFEFPKAINRIRGTHSLLTESFRLNKLIFFKLFHYLTFTQNSVWPSLKWRKYKPFTKYNICRMSSCMHLKVLLKWYYIFLVFQII